MLNYISENSLSLPSTKPYFFQKCHSGTADLRGSLSQLLVASTSTELITMPGLPPL